MNILRKSLSLALLLGGASLAACGGDKPADPNLPGGPVNTSGAPDTSKTDTSGKPDLSKTDTSGKPDLSKTDTSGKPDTSKMNGPSAPVGGALNTGGGPAILKGKDAGAGK